MAKTLRIDEKPEGFIACCHGSSSPFSFLAGQRELSVTEIHDNYLFSTRASKGPYLLQFIWPDLDKSIADLGSEHDLEILADYCRWEMDYQEQTLRRKLVPESLGAMKLPTGRYFITRYSEPVDDVDSSTPEAETAGSNEDLSDGLDATPYSGYVCMRNDHELVVFTIQGLGSGWTPASVRLKAMRIAFSTFFE